MRSNHAGQRQDTRPRLWAPLHARLGLARPPNQSQGPDGFLCGHPLPPTFATALPDQTILYLVSYLVPLYLLLPVPSSLSALGLGPSPKGTSWPCHTPM